MKNVLRIAMTLGVGLCGVQPMLLNGAAPAVDDSKGKDVVGPEYSGGPRKKAVSGPLQLTEAVNLALRQNPDVLKAVREIQRVQGQIVEARAAALPHLSLNTEVGRTDPGLYGPNTNIQANAWNVTFQLRQVLYDGGQFGAAIRAAKLTQDVSYYNLRDVLDRTVGEVRKQFAQVLVTKALIEVAQESVELASKQLEDATNRFNAGTVPRFNVLRAEVELASVKPNLIKAKNEYLIAQLQLAKLLGLDPAPDARKDVLQCQGELKVMSVPYNLADALILSRARRASLKSQRQQIKVEAERITIAGAGFKPKIDAKAEYRFQSRSDTSRFEDSLNGYFLGITGKWNIFDSFETTAQVDQAKARMQSAVLSYQDAVQTVELEVQKAHADLVQYRETIESQQKNVEQANEALRLAQERLSAGAGTQLEVLDARLALTRARTTALQAQGDYVRSMAEFERATATATVYEESFKDPLSVLEKKVLKQAPEQLFRVSSPKVK